MAHERKPWIESESSPVLDRDLVVHRVTAYTTGGIDNRGLVYGTTRCGHGARALGLGQFGRHLPVAYCIACYSPKTLPTTPER